MKGPGIAGLAAAALLAAATPVRAQVGVGGYYVHTSDPFGESGGVGVRLQAGAPLLPLSVALNGAYFFDCGASDCSQKGLTIDVNYSLAVPLIQPYVGAGWSIRERSLSGEDRTERGLNVGVGVAVALRSFRPFVDVRYRPTKVFSGHPYAVRFGLMLH